MQFEIGIYRSLQIKNGIWCNQQINLLAPEFFFLNLARPVYKMWIIQEQNTLELWKKNCILKRKERRVKYHV